VNPTLLRRVGVTAALVLASGALAVSAPRAVFAAGSPDTITPSSISNTETQHGFSITTPTPYLYTTSAGVSVRLSGPGTYQPTRQVPALAQDTPQGCIPGTCTGSTVFLADPADLGFGSRVLPAPGNYTFTVCIGDGAFSGGTADCSTSTDTGPWLVTGKAPQVTAAIPASVIMQGDSADSVTLAGQHFADGDHVTVSKDGTAVPGITFTPNFASFSTNSTRLLGSVAVAQDVPSGVYDLTVTDTSPTPQHATLAGALVVGGTLQVTDVTATPKAGGTAALSWTQVPPPSGFTVTGYNFVVTTDDDPIGDQVTQSDPGVVVSQTSPTATTGTISGLFSGQRYSILVTPQGTVGGSSFSGLRSPVASMRALIQTTLTLAAAANPVVEGKSATLAGKLTRNFGSHAEPDPKADVDLYTVDAQHHSHLVTHLTTKSDGSFVAHVSPTASTTYVAYFAGTAPAGNNAGDATSVSTPLVLAVAQKVLAHAKDASLAKHQKLVVNGSVTPAASGHKIELDYVRGKTTHRVASTKLASDGSFTFNTKAKKLKSGKRYQLVVTSAATATNAEGVSSTFSVSRG
jgi:hypothetical protein